VIGIVTIIAGFLTPPRPIVVGPEAEFVGRRTNDEAATFDFRLEICRMVGLTMFCAGGLILAVSLMVPTFFYHGGSYGPSAALGADETASSQPVIVDTEGSDSEVPCRIEMIIITVIIIMNYKGAASRYAGTSLLHAQRLSHTSTEHLIRQVQ